jgi:hypothetical protein
MFLFQFRDHEGFVDAVLVADPALARPPEAEATVVARLAQYHRCPVAGFPTGQQPFTDQARADALTLVFGHHADRSEPHDAEVRFRRIENRRGEQYVTDYRVLDESD